MNNKDLYDQTFCEAFEIEKSALPGLMYTGIPQWDSVGHMLLMSLLEKAFDIMLDTDDIIDFNSYEKGIEILKEHYDVEF